MKEQLIQYVDLLFAGTSGCEDVHQEILQNTLDRYDDLIAEGKVPEAAYRMAITGIGDITEILNASSTQNAPVHSTVNTPEITMDSPEKKRARALAVGLYIAAAIPLLLLSSFGLDTLGLCLTLLLVAAATVLMIQNSSKAQQQAETQEPSHPNSVEAPLKKSINALIWSLGLVIYFFLSFSTGAWYITWLIFPMIGAVKGLAGAILDLKEAAKYEN